MKDRRIKCCPNETCKYTSKHKVVSHSADTKYCPTCGLELSFACSKCFGPIENNGPKHKTCSHCEAKAADKREKRKENAAKIAAGAATLASAAIGVAIKRKR